MKIFTYGIIGIVAVAVIAGFFIVGSPNSERIRRFDTRREADLSMIQSEITYYWQSKQMLPATLDNLNDDLRGVSIPVDPETGRTYEYRVVGEKTFELCGTFSLPSRETNSLPEVSRAAPEKISNPILPNDPWKRESAGRACFNRTIDPAFFPPIGKK